MNAPAEPNCTRCGAALARAPAGPVGAVGPRTMLGLGTSSGGAALPPEPLAPGALHRTLLGMPTPGPPAAPPTGATEPPAPRPGQTLLGMPLFTPAGSPAPAPPGAPANPPPAAPPYPQPAEPPPPSSTAMISQQKTMLGVALPGIAPLNPGVAKPPAPVPPMAAPSAPGPAFAPSPALAPPAVASAPARPRSRVGVVMALGALTLATLAAAVVLAVWVWRSAPPLRATVRADANGHEALALSCDSCKDGTLARLDGSEATFANRAATLPLARPLAIGDNRLELELIPPGARDAKRVSLVVPIDFRIRGDLEPLSREPPSVAVRAELRPGSSITVDGHPLEVGADGAASYSLDVSSALTGTAAPVETLEKKLPFTITAPGGRPESGEVTLQIGITPLVVDAPTDGMVIEAPRVLIAGATQVGGSVRIGARAAAVDQNGRFAQLMDVPSFGETTVTVYASAKERAPRRAPVTVLRVESLAKEAARRKQTATRDYAALAKGLASATGREVALAGSVVEARVERHTTTLLLDVTTGCARPPCLARVVYGGERPAARGAKVTAFGRVTRAVDGPRTGASIPEISASFIVDGVVR